jgi:hypothetical protein
MASVTATIGISVKGARVVTSPVGGDGDSPLFELVKVLKWAAGTSTSQVDEVWTRAKTLSTGSETLNLNDLDQTDSGGSNVERAGINFSVIKGLIVVNTGTPGGSGYLRLGGAASTAWEGNGTPFQASGSKIDVPPGEMFLWTNSVGATTSSLNSLKVEAVTADQGYKMILLGESGA